MQRLGGRRRIKWSEVEIQAEEPDGDALWAAFKARFAWFGDVFEGVLRLKGSRRRCDSKDVDLGSHSL